MRLKFFITYIMIMLCFVMGSMAELPHHHHNGGICMNFNHMKEQHSRSNGKNGNCNSCCYNNINAYISQNTEQATEFTDAYINPYAIYIIAYNDILIGSANNLYYNLYLEKLHSRHLIKSKGLRSPPHFFIN